MSAKSITGSAARSVKKWVIDSDVENQLRWQALVRRLRDESLSHGLIELSLKCPNQKRVRYTNASDNMKSTRGAERRSNNNSSLRSSFFRSRFEQPFPPLVAITSRVGGPCGCSKGPSFAHLACIYVLNAPCSIVLIFSPKLTDLSTAFLMKLCSPILVRASLKTTLSSSSQAWNAHVPIVVSPSLK